MRYIIAAAAFAVVAGIALGVVVSGGLDGSASAAPKAQVVREENVDASGFIAIHEQGVADVSGTVDVGNLPLDAEGSLRVASTAGSSKTSELFTGTINPGETLQTPFVDVRGCFEFTIFILNAGQASVGTIGNVELMLSADGVRPYGTVKSNVNHSALDGLQVNLAEGYFASPELFGFKTPAITTPFAGARLRSPTSLPARNITVTLHCT